MSRPTVERISETVGAFYEAAYDSTLWIDAIATLCNLFDGSRACIVHFNGVRYNSLASARDDEFSSVDCLEAHMRDPWGHAMLMLPMGAVHNREEMIDQTAFRRRELWRDWYMPRDLYNGLSCKLTSSRGSLWFIDVQRGMRQAQFNRSEIDLLEVLVPHVLRANQISRQLEATTNLAGVEREPALGMAVVNGHREVIDMTEAAAATISSSDSPLQLRGGKLVSTNLEADIQLQRLVEDACSSQSDAMPGTGGLLSIDAGQERTETQLALTVAPFMDVHRFGLPYERRAMVLIGDARAPTPVGMGASARKKFKLTKAEAGLANAIASGRTLKEACAEAEITYKSGRTYMERIFAKTGVRQQSQLVALMAAGAR